MASGSRLVREVAWVALAIAAALSLFVLVLTLQQAFGSVERAAMLVTTVVLAWASARVHATARRS